MPTYYPQDAADVVLFVTVALCGIIGFAAYVAWIYDKLYPLPYEDELKEQGIKLSGARGKITLQGNGTHTGPGSTSYYFVDDEGEWHDAINAAEQERIAAQHCAKVNAKRAEVRNG